MGKKGKKAQAGKPKKLTPKDVGKRLDALVKKLEEELKGADLFAPVPPTEDCPICLVPLPRETGKSTFWSCCGKFICIGCAREHEDHEECERGKLEPACPFCREPAPSTDEEIVQKLEFRASKNDSQALYNIGCLYRDGLEGLPVDNPKALHYWTRAAELGNSLAMTNIGLCYKDGKEVPIDWEKAALFFRVATLNANINGRHNTGVIEYDYFGNHQVGIRHWKIAAEAGFQPSLNILRDIFNGHGESPGKEFIAKEDMEKIYRACHAAQEEVKSEEREKHLRSDK